MLSDATKAHWKTYWIWFFWVSLAFFTVYPLCNWFTAQRSFYFSPYFEFELAIPLVKEFFWPYFSMYLLFFVPPFILNRQQLSLMGKQLVIATLISGLTFLLLPAKLGFPRLIPDDPFYAKIFTQMFALDLPYNTVPSLHIVFSTILVLHINKASQSPILKLLMMIWLILLYISTILVHQHHLLDIITGFLVAFVLFRWQPIRNSP